MISKLVIVGLILVWAVVLLPDVLQRINRGRRGDTIRSFNSQLTSLGRSQGSAPGSIPGGSLASGDRSSGSLSSGSLSSENVIDLRSRVTGADSVARSDNPAAASHRRARPEVSHPRSDATATSRRHAPAAARPVSPAVRKRRQDVIVSLASVAVLTLLATVAFGSAFLYIHLLADLLLAAYLVLLVRAGATQPVAAAPVSRSGTQARRDPGLAPIGPLTTMNTATVSSPRPLDPQRIAN